MEDSKQIRFCGFGGQGIVLAGMIFGSSSMDEWKYVAGSNSYDSKARGGACRADVVISREPIAYPKVIKADLMVAMSQEAYDGAINEVVEGGVVFYDEQVAVKEIPGTRQVKIPATSVALKELNNPMVANMVMLGEFTELTKLVSRASLTKAVRANTPKRFVDLNLKAIEVGFELGKKEGKHA